jgi:hypothetical protein
VGYPALRRCQRTLTRLCNLFEAEPFDVAEHGRMAVITFLLLSNAGHLDFEGVRTGSESDRITRDLDDPVAGAPGSDTVFFSSFGLRRLYQVEAGKT